MALWTNTDNTAGKPKNLSTDDKAITYGVDVTEAKQKENRDKGVKTPGWTKTEQYTNAQGVVRNKTEILVAFGGNMSSDASDDSIVVDRTITIATAPVAASVTAPAAASFTVAASASPTTTLSYTWQTNGGSGSTYSNIEDAGVYSGASTATLSISDSTGLNGYKYRVAVSADGASIKTSAGVTLTVA